MRLPIVLLALLSALSGCTTTSLPATNPGRPAALPMPGAARPSPSFDVADTLPSPVRRDSAFWLRASGDIRAALGVEMQRALLAQRLAWQDSERKSHAPQRVNEHPEPQGIRTARVHCHREDFEASNQWSRYTIVALVSSTVSRMSLCPHWIPADPDPLREPTHEYRGEVVEPARLVPFPAELISGLDSARERLPDDRWIIGQLVRIHTEHAKPDEARRILAHCGADPGWCGLLSAYAEFVSGRYAVADSMFQSAIRLLSVEEQCAWQSLHLLLPPTEAPHYDRLDCSARKEYAETFWWLATPLFSSQGNERRAEHYARILRNELVNTLPLDAQYDLRLSKGQDAVTRVRTRYGWADHVMWGDDLLEFEHDNYLGFDRGRPYSAPEYGTRRTSTIPSGRAVRSPLSVIDDDFELHAPRGSVHNWWPQEHFRHPGGVIVAFRYPQHALLRRDNAALLMMAGDLRGGALDAVRGRSLESHLVLSRSTTHRELVEKTTVRGGDRVVMQTPLTSPAIAGLEVRVAMEGVAAARTRLGVSVIPTLTALSAGSCALSDPILVRPEMTLQSPARALSDNMLGSIALDDPARVGIAWESYGFTPGDTVRVGIRVERVVEVGALRSLAMRVRLASDPRSSVRISWQEPDPSRAGAALQSGNKAIVLRHLTIDVSRLDAGDYRATVDMERAGCKVSSNVREFRIWR